MRRVSALFTAALLVATSAVASSPAEPKRPNILLALADNWGWHAGALGDPMAITPTFDRIAREGVLFTHAFCPVPSCTPTRSSLLTGRAAHQLADAASLHCKFVGTHRVFTQELREGGYEAGFTGKGWSPGNFKDFGWTENPVGRQYRSLTDFLGGRDTAKPFFFWLGNTDSALHRWRYEPAAWAGLDETKLVIPPQFPDDPATRRTLLGYYGAVRRMDAAMGEALQELERRGLLEDTIVVFTSDNGWQMPRGLANCYDGGTRVPMAVRWGANRGGGRRHDEFISLTDLAPTFLELAGLPVPAAMTGRSFADLILRGTSTTRRDAVFVERERHANVRRGDLSYPIRGIRTDDFLYLWNLRPDRWPAGDPELYHAVGPYGDVDRSPLKDLLVDRADRPELQWYREISLGHRPEEELFDLRTDPHQLRNVAADANYAGDKARLRSRVGAWMRETGDPRVDPAYDGWDQMPYFGPNFREVMAKERKGASAKTRAKYDLLRK